MLTIRPYHAVLVVATLLAAALPAVGQSKEATKQQVESQLKQMSPEEIDRRFSGDVFVTQVEVAVG